ncbi:hypothetical protein CEXT_190881 [Caerostris extrusa]|uniref:Uncharacterized protein n=1 Tax=Caerostris extrusa TaxID=172846 RepID=A0AAV4TVS9_CAEEX|nr:hypothetical protein CEXT_190881 [Caerostris extrusa]
MVSDSSNQRQRAQARSCIPGIPAPSFTRCCAGFCEALEIKSHAPEYLFQLLQIPNSINSRLKLSSLTFMADVPMKSHCSSICANQS